MVGSKSYGLKKAQKPRDSILGTIFYRKISIRISRALVKTNITPNQMTVISFCIVVIASITFTTGDYIYMVIGAIMLHLALVLDCVDGEIARMKSMQSKSGALLDESLDNIGYTFVFLFIAYGVYLQSGIIWIWPLTLFIVAGHLMKTVTRLMVQNLNLGNTSWKKVEEKIGGSRFILGWGGGFDEVLITLGAVFNQFIIILIIIFLGVNAHWIGKLILNLRK